MFVVRARKGELQGLACQKARFRASPSRGRQFIGLSVVSLKPCGMVTFAFNIWPPKPCILGHSCLPLSTGTFYTSGSVFSLPGSFALVSPFFVPIASHLTGSHSACPFFPDYGRQRFLPYDLPLLCPVRKYWTALLGEGILMSSCLSICASTP